MQYYDSSKAENKFDAKLFYMDIVCEDVKVIMQKWEDLMGVSFVKNGFMNELFSENFHHEDSFDFTITEDKAIQIFAEIHQYGVQVKSAYNVIEIMRTCFIDYKRCGINYNKIVALTRCQVLWKSICNMLCERKYDEVKVGDVIRVPKHGIIGIVKQVGKSTLKYNPARFGSNQFFVSQYKHDRILDNEYDIKIKDVIVIEPIINNNIFYCASS